jgi:uncharacterized protein
MDPIDIIQRYYDSASKAYRILVSHGRQVAEKALQAAQAVEHLHPNTDLIERAAMLHDIGMLGTNVPKLGCDGQEPYIRHGVIGREMLEREGMPAEALICERHVGAGISAMEICRRRLPLPKRDMLPVSLEEQIVCYADKFFSKNINRRNSEKSTQAILKSLARHGDEQVSRFKAWMEIFGF